MLCSRSRLADWLLRPKRPEVSRREQRGAFTTSASSLRGAAATRNGLPLQLPADHALMNYAMTTSDSVAKLTLNRLDKGELYTTPQVDAKLFWMMKRATPNLYANLLGFSYRFVKN